MNVRKSHIGLAVTVLFCLATATLATPSLVNWWHGLSQSQRNTEILNTALDQVGDYTGLQCKAWVQDVVDEASDGVVNPPQNQNDYTWYTSSNVRVLPRPFPIDAVQPGQIIQMRWRNHDGSIHPHTAIVKNKTSTKMTWVDCNWNGDETVRVHTIYFSDFYWAVNGYNYNVYEIK